MLIMSVGEEFLLGIFILNFIVNGFFIDEVGMVCISGIRFG